MSNFTLGKAQVGDKLKLSKRGSVWTVIHKTPHPQFNTVIQLKKVSVLSELAHWTNENLQDGNRTQICENGDVLL